MNQKISIVGTGQVGMAIAYSLLIENLADEMVLIDTLFEKAEGEAMDLQHAMPFLKPMKIKAGTIEDCLDSRIIVITAGAKRKAGESRLDLMKRNQSLFADLIPRLERVSPNSIYLIVSNPVDIMTQLTLQYSNLSKQQVIGSGTILDTARFRSILSEKLDMDVRNIHASIIGEHGDSEVPVWSKANLYGKPILEFMQEKNVTQKEIADYVKTVAMDVIQRKGATCYGVGLGSLRIIEAILRNQKRVLTVSTYLDGEYGISDTCLSLPCVVGKNGIEGKILWDLSPEELGLLKQSAQKLQENYQQLDF